MDKKTLRALNGSIKKWEGIVAGTTNDDGPDNCPLCKVFFKADCIACPVLKSTGLPSCEGTPYEEWSNYLYDNGVLIRRIPFDATSKKLAAKEVKFLKSLLPAPR